jgi:hypothetical protein
MSTIAYLKSSNLGREARQLYKAYLRLIPQTIHQYELWGVPIIQVRPLRVCVVPVIALCLCRNTRLSARR